MKGELRMNKDIFPLPVKVSSKYSFSFKNTNILKNKYHLTLAETGDAYYGKAPNYHKLRKIQKFCQQNHLKFEINNSFGKRSNSYRTTFFKHYPPLPGNKYLCAYCGKKLPKNKITIDHLYPVYLVNKSSHYQTKLMKYGITNVNDYRNLVPACASCNIKKKTKTGIWIIRGKIGRNVHIWYIRKIFRFVFILSICFIIFYNYIK